MDERQFPIYRITASWDEDREDGRKETGTSFEKMFREDPGIEGAQKYAEDWWEKNLDATDDHWRKVSLRERNVSLKDLRVEFTGNETWVLTWFSHSTFNVHLTDEEVLESFADFVERKQRENVKNGHCRTEANYHNKKAGRYYCLMGAEDRWRWKGPCRCEHCIGFGLTRIDH